MRGGLWDTLKKNSFTIFVVLIYRCPYAPTIQHTHGHVIPLQILTWILYIVTNLAMHKDKKNERNEKKSNSALWEDLLSCVCDGYHCRLSKHLLIVCLCQPPPNPCSPFVAMNSHVMLSKDGRGLRLQLFWGRGYAHVCLFVSLVNKEGATKAFLNDWSKRQLFTIASQIRLPRLHSRNRHSSNVPLR